MPYMPTNLYPKNCAIQKKSDNLVNIDFLAKLDTNDKIIGYTVHLYAYGNSEPVYTISYNADDETNKHTIIGPENNITTIDISEFDNGFCITENNDFKLSCQNLLLEQLKYTWEAIFVGSSYDIWVVDGEVQESSSTDIKIFPSILINPTSNQINNNKNEVSNFIIKNGYYDKTTTATKIEVDDDVTTVTLADSLFPTDNKDVVDLYVTIDTTEYPVKTIKGNVLTVNGSHPLSSTTVFGQYINVYRKYMTLTLNEQILSKGQEFFIYSNAIKTNVNYFTTIDRELKFEDEDIIDLESVLRNFKASYDGKVVWHQFELLRGNTTVDKTEKIYSNKLEYQYNNFYSDSATSPQQYVLKLTVHDVENCDYTANLIINASYYRKGTSDKVVAFWDYDNKAIKIDLSKTVSSEATLYKNDKKINSNENVYDFITDGGKTRLYIQPDSRIEYKEKTEGKVEFSRLSNMLIKLKLNEHFDGSVFKFGDKTFSITENEIMINEEDKMGGNVFIFDNSVKPIYSNYSPDIIRNGNDNIDTQYYLAEDTTYTFSDDSYFSYNDILAEDYWYALITQDSTSLKGSIAIYSTNENYAPKSFEFESFNSTIDGLTLFGGVTYEYIKISSSKIDISIENGVINEEETDENNLKWTTGNSFVTNYNDKAINVSNVEPIPAGATKKDIIIYKRCELLDNLNEQPQLLYLGQYPANLKILYDYSVADDHRYTYYVIQTYSIQENGKEVTKALAEIISQTIVPDYYEIDVFGTDYNLSSVEKNIYILDKNQKWYFELDAICDNIDFVNEQNIYSFNQYAKINKTDVNYMKGSVTAKLGNLSQEVNYINDNRHCLDRFQKFANSHSIKIIRLKDGLVIPVDIQLKQKKNQSNLIGNPTDIVFDWYQVADAETAVLVEYEVE